MAGTALAVAGSSTARAADVDVATSTSSGLHLDSFSGTTALIESGVTVSNTAFDCPTPPPPGAMQVAAVCATTKAWTLTNLGTIGAPSYGAGVLFTAGGTVINAGSIGASIVIEGGTGGTVNNQLGGTITGDIVIGLDSGVAGTVTNAGTIANASGGQAISLWGGGTVINLATGVIEAHGEANAIAIIQGTSRSVENYGIIRSNDTGFATGVSLQSGTLTNYAGGQILGAYNGIWTYSGPSTITNYGLIEASQANTLFGLPGSAIEVDAGGTIVNAGTIRSNSMDGSDVGIYFTGAGSITNSGTIQSLDGGLAIQFNGGATHTLNLDTGSVLGGNVQGGSGIDNLVLLGSGTESIDKFLGFETLSMQGGAWTLTNSGVFSTSATVQSGLLDVNGQLTSPNVTVMAGATLGGTGTIVGNVINNGNVAPGNSIGTLNITGNYTQTNGSTLTPEVNTTSGDLLHITGTATIQAGASVNVQVAPGFYALGYRYTILTALGGVTGTYTTLTDDAPFVDFLLAYDPTNVYLDVVLSGLPFAQVAQTPNEKAAASGLQSLGVGNPIFDAAIMLNTPDALRAFDLLSGEVHASMVGTLLDESRFIRDSIFDRLHQSFGGPGTPLAPQTAMLNFGANALGYADEGGKQVPGIDRALTARADAGPSYAVWAQPFGDWGRTSSDGNAGTLTRKSGGFIGGADATMGDPRGDAWRAGFAGGYRRTSLDIDDRSSSGSIDSYDLAAYAAAQHGALGLRFGSAYSWHNLGASRAIAFSGFSDATSASYDARTAQVFGEIGYDTTWRNMQLEPFGGLAFVDVHTDGFTENGGPASLVGASGNSDTTFSSLGLRAATPLPGMAGLTARGSFAWRHAFATVTPTAQLAFASGGTSFIVAGVPIAKDAAEIEIGLDGQISRLATLGISYSGQLAAHAQDHAVKVNFVQRF